MPIKKYLLAGLLVWTPLAITVWVLQWIIGTLDQTLLILPAGWQPDKLLGVLHHIERHAGRFRDGERDQPRTLDLDMLLLGPHGEVVMVTSDLVVPHPRLHERAFALRPVLDLAPSLVHPALGVPLSDLLASLPLIIFSVISMAEATGQTIATAESGVVLSGRGIQAGDQQQFVLQSRAVFAEQPGASARRRRHRAQSRIGSAEPRGGSHDCAPEVVAVAGIDGAIHGAGMGVHGE